MAEITQAARDEFRARFLLACYQKHGTKQAWEKDGGLIAVGLAVAKEMGLEEAEARAAYFYLARRGYITTTMQGGGNVTPAGQDLADGMLRRLERQRTPGDGEERSFERDSRIRLFISHASADAAFAESVVKLLRSALSLPPGAIRFTSVDGFGLPGGADIDDQLREDVIGAELVLGIISPRSLASLFVVFELGARWGAGRPLVPLMAPGAEASAMKGPLARKNALRSETAAQLHVLIADVGKELSIEPNKPATYQTELEAVLELAKREKVPRRR